MNCKSVQRLLNYSNLQKIERNWLPMQDEKRLLLVYSFFPVMKILELESSLKVYNDFSSTPCFKCKYKMVFQDGADLTDFREITTSDSLDNIFNDIAREANITVTAAKRNIEIHGSSPILLVRNYLLGND